MGQSVIVSFIYSLCDSLLLSPCVKAMGASGIVDGENK